MKPPRADRATRVDRGRKIGSAKKERAARQRIGDTSRLRNRAAGADRNATLCPPTHDRSFETTQLIIASLARRTASWRSRSREASTFPPGARRDIVRHRVRRETEKCGRSKRVASVYRATGAHAPPPPSPPPPSPTARKEPLVVGSCPPPPGPRDRRFTFKVAQVRWTVPGTRAGHRFTRATAWWPLHR